MQETSTVSVHFRILVKEELNRFNPKNMFHFKRLIVSV